MASLYFMLIEHTIIKIVSLLTPSESFLNPAPTATRVTFILVILKPCPHFLWLEDDKRMQSLFFSAEVAGEGGMNPIKLTRRSTNVIMPHSVCKELMTGEQRGN